jgi:hypothetical protein
LQNIPDAEYRKNATVNNGGFSMNRISRIVLCWLLLVPCAGWGQWNRLILSPKGRRMQLGTAHPLNYFTANPFLRDDDHDFCRLCVPSDTEKFDVDTEVHSIGTLSGFPVVEIFYRFRPKGDAEWGLVKWKSILVQTKADQMKADQTDADQKEANQPGERQYIEIYHLQAYYTTASLGPAWIAQSGTEQVLATNDSDGSNGGGCFDGYWSFDAGGPTPLDFSAVWREIEKRIPDGAKYTTHCHALHLEQQTIESSVQSPDAECHACGRLGTVAVKFRLEGWHVEPVSVDFRAGE